MNGRFAVFFTAFDSKYQYHQSLCQRRFDTRQQAEFYAEEIRRRTTVAFMDDNGKWIQSKDVLRLHVMQEVYGLWLMAREES